MDPHMHMGMPTGPGHAPGWTSVSAEHSIALVGVLFLPAVLVGLLIALRYMAPHSARASALIEGIDGASASTHVATLLMLIAAAIHIALVPVHLHDPVRAGLFALNGFAFIGVSALAYTSRRWRATAAVLAVATIGAYAFYLAAGLEDADLIGVFSKVVELGALLAVGVSALVIPRGPSGDPGDPDGRKQHRSHQRTTNTQPQEVLG